MAKNIETSGSLHGIERVARVLIFGAISVVGLGVVCIVLTLVGSVTGASNSRAGIWPTINLLPEIAFPIAVLMILALIVVNIVRLSRKNKGTSR
ncbi:hypothetical protein AX769_07085 [Frondihabitans sp. PAMC 28766]|uniref:hypothetical protein n=1 Tax=Frondihabitans sp. PAMC 28766 TaxID=1795630 RepID=UPI00078CF76B|nr:hypothetical protein [Frondihabitans sp. PAMC 28766]AMM19965.1 hypothetical protein AX769_07085 [Frondihabitans sp. PAMC 28766]